MSSKHSYIKPMEIRHEQPSDILGIYQLTADAFAPMAFSDGTEPAVIDALRLAGELTLSLVAIKKHVLVGHIAFSPITVGSSSNNWYGLGPISVLPELQHTGIGSGLIKEGFRMLRDKQAEGCALIGNPNYYSRFGFISDGNVHYKSVPDKNVQWISFNDKRPTGQLEFSAAFGD